MTAATTSPSSPVLGVLFRPVSDGPFSAARRVTSFAIAVVVLCGVVALDYRTTPQARLGPVYLLPVVLAAWFGGRWPGHLTAAAAAVAWCAVPRQPAAQASGTWSLVTGSLLPRLIVYPAVVELLTLLQDAERRLRLAVAERTAELQAQVAERHRAEAALRAIAAQVSAAEDAERRRVAYDIHDALSQMLGVVKLNLQTAAAELPIDARPFARINDVVGVVDDLIRQTRDLTFDLHPAMLDDLGLAPTLRQFAVTFGRRTLAEVTVNELGAAPVPAPPAAVVAYLFRATKEAVANAVRHGNARDVIVAVHWEAGRVRVVVDDDGSGFDPAVAPAVSRPGRGLGLAGMTERLAGLGGRLRVESQPGRGARVILEVPIARDAAAASAAGPQPADQVGANA